ncbi:Protein of unknown function [Salegentibacter echinorum]|uniref:DUF3822 domain-containing protein n=1 Tax=Salegentibacter echinorum TaxID=1073325 RepID=A0A1M5CRA9_SALEC|nr:DUF3822 family protein [Salegentibacter echinorum]SHF57278.1 Protein of unknown function [Salegentibacter echinorum]
MVTSKTKVEKDLELSIQVSLDGLSFCTRNPKENALTHYHKIKFEQQLDPIKLLEEIEAIFEKETVFQQVNHLKLIFDHSLYSFVPKTLFKEENASDYLKFNTKILQTDFIANEEIGNTGIVNIYIPYTNIINFFFEKFGEFEYQHLTSILTKTLLSYTTNTEPQVYAHVKDKEFDLLVLESEKVLLCNTFQFNEKEDFLYYLLFTAEQLNLDPQNFQLYLLGAIDDSSPLYKIAYTYIRNIDFLKTNFSFKRKKESEKINFLEEFILLKSFE